jgi:hypothetical protein
MSVEAKRARRRAKRSTSQSPPPWAFSALDAPLATSHPNQILTFHEWCRLNRISLRTGRRIVTSGKGPIVTQLSTKRIGISIANNAAWQQSRERA